MNEWIQPNAKSCQFYFLNIFDISPPLSIPQALSGSKPLASQQHYSIGPLTSNPTHLQSTLYIAGNVMDQEPGPTMLPGRRSNGLS